MIVQEIGATEDAPDDLVFDRLQETAFPDQPVGRSILGTPRDRALVQRRRACAPISSRNYRAPDMVVAAAGAVEHDADRRRGREALRQLRRAGGAGAGAGAFRRRHARRDARSRAGAHRPGAARPAGARPAALQPAGLHQRARRRHVVASVPGSAREPRALLRDPRLPHALSRHRHVRALCRHRRDRCAGTDARRRSTRSATPPRRSPRPRSPAPRRR